MTRAEIIALQESLNQQGFNLVVDGRYGQKTRDAYAEYLDRDNAVPTQVPPAPKPWYLSRSIIGLLATIAAGLLGRSGYLVDAGELTNVLLQIVEAGGLVLAFVGTVRRRVPIDNGAAAPGLRLPSRANPVPAEREADSEHLRGPFGY
jgi:peptidoglycan hydrolase-like protein with peptidoglycan-binding domain